MSQPHTLSTALWRPTSSRNTRGSSAASHHTAAWSPPVASNAVCWVRTRAGSASNAATSSGGPAGTGVSPARMASRCARPHSPHAAVAVKWRSSLLQSNTCPGLSSKSMTSGASLHPACCSRTPMTSVAEATTRSPARNPIASSRS